MAKSEDRPLTTLSMRSGGGGSQPGAQTVTPRGDRSKAIPKSAYNTLGSFYRTINARLWNLHRIQLLDYVDVFLPDGNSLGEGINFIPSDDRALRALLVESGGFHWDDRRFWIYREAASHTIGEGYREYGIPSIHFQLAPAFCNVHVDMYGFVFRLPTGDAFSPDMFQHIVDELWWADLVAAIRKRSAFAGELFQRLHPRIPSSTTGYRLGIGGEFDILRRFKPDLTQMTLVSLEFTQDVNLSPCDPRSCSVSDQAGFGGWQLQLKVRGTF